MLYVLYELRSAKLMPAAALMWRVGALSGSEGCRGKVDGVVRKVRRVVGEP